MQEQLGEAGLIAVVRADGKEAAEETIHRLIDKGITAIEITYTTPGASELIENCGKDGLLVGAGTVVESEQAREAAAAGSKFIVSPGFRNHWLRRPHHCIHFYSRRINAKRNYGSGLKGFRVLKLFPGGTSGIPYMKNLAGPFRRFGSYQPEESIPAMWRSGLMPEHWQ
ncbi:bifunctional 4-hydroxy-2-oxoglutarate aldolase/2-dehydro-3-deoxy-phosphogluconate aldolase [Bacillus licheniformis]|nr:bifunctional 4-hydroxy-2-oxoglutarate aldolase/2-dehydro-3-deoxy-phosphogluconate aldolase [Bacillus licheniformis]